MPKRPGKGSKGAPAGRGVAKQKKKKKVTGTQSTRRGY